MEKNLLLRMYFVKECSVQNIVVPKKSQEGYHKPTNKVWYSEMGLLTGRLLNSDSDRED